MKKVVYHFTIEVRDSNNKLYLDLQNNKVLNFKFKEELESNNVPPVMWEELLKYIAISKEGSVVTVTVSLKNNISDTYMEIMSIDSITKVVKKY